MSVKSIRGKGVIVPKVRVIRVAYWALILVLMGACGGQQVKKQSLPEEARPAAKASPVSSKRQSSRERLIKELLASAQLAFRDGRLTTPSHDNAYDLFQSVLTLDPQNSSARAGVQAILIRYADWARDAMAAGDYVKSQAYLEQAQIYFPANPLLLELQQKVRRERQLRAKREHAVLRKDPEEKRSEFSLPGGALKKKSPAVVEYLKRLAKRVQESNESVMIYARTDAEGRWIYQQLNKATEGYRVRGDIRISRSPKIVLMPPL